MTTWLTSGVGLTSAAGAVVVVAVVAVVVLKSPDVPDAVPAAVLKSPDVPDAVPAAVLALVDKPEPQVAEGVDPTEPPKTTKLAVAQIDTGLTGPTFDLVRVEADGTAVIAGTTTPGAVVRVRFGADVIQTVTADSRGAFVVLADLPSTGGARPLILELLAANGQIVPSLDSVLVMPQTAVAQAPPKIVMVSADGVKLLQTGAEDLPEAETASAPVVVDLEVATAETPTGPTQNFGLSLDTISYDETGDVVLSGRGSSDQFVRIYVDNKPIETETVLSDGQWKVVLPEVKEGIYTLRVDEIDAQGVVTSRVESPFKRETPEIVAAANIQPVTGSITVQPGHTLWALARDQYGDGVKYVQIFDANRDRIRNPNLIYPGQVFELPK